jgi:hypothetical protein
MLMEDPVATAEMVCQDLPAEEGKALVRDFAKHSAQSFGTELTHMGCKDAPASYLLCEDDMAGSASFQRHMIALIEEASGRQVDVTTIKTGYFPNLAAERETVEWIRKVVEKAQGSQ